jgi:hypothetical protein
VGIKEVNMPDKNKDKGWLEKAEEAVGMNKDKSKDKKKK